MLLTATSLLNQELGISFLFILDLVINAMHLVKGFVVLVLVGCLEVLMMVVMLDTVSPSARLHAKHERHADNDEEEEEQRDTFLPLEEVDILLALLQEVVDHHVNDSGAVSQSEHRAAVLCECSIGKLVFRAWRVQGRVSIHFIDPLNDDKSVHPSEKTVKNNEATD